MMKGGLPCLLALWTHILKLVATQKALSGLDLDWENPLCDY